VRALAAIGLEGAVVFGALTRRRVVRRIPAPWRPGTPGPGVMMRARELGLEIGALAVGPANTITDVEGARHRAEVGKPALYNDLRFGGGHRRLLPPLLPGATLHARRLLPIAH
jgi:hypothetical protein